MFNVVHVTRWWAWIVDSYGCSHTSGFLDESVRAFAGRRHRCRRVGVVKAGVGSGVLQRRSFFSPTFAKGRGFVTASPTVVAGG
jgi:hypothetical protein